MQIVPLLAKYISSKTFRVVGLAGFTPLSSEDPLHDLRNNADTRASLLAQTPKHTHETAGQSGRVERPRGGSASGAGPSP